MTFNKEVVSFTPVALIRAIVMLALIVVLTEFRENCVRATFIVPDPETIEPDVHSDVEGNVVGIYLLLKDDTLVEGEGGEGGKMEDLEQHHRDANSTNVNYFTVLSRIRGQGGGVYKYVHFKAETKLGRRIVDIRQDGKTYKCKERSRHHNESQSLKKFFQMKFKCGPDMSITVYQRKEGGNVQMRKFHRTTTMDGSKIGPILKNIVVKSYVKLKKADDDMKNEELMKYITLKKDGRVVNRKSFLRWLRKKGIAVSRPKKQPGDVLNATPTANVAEQSRGSDIVSSPIAIKQ